MTQITPNRADILKDIEVYENRLRNAQAKLLGLSGHLAGRKLKQAGRALLSEIRHVRTLIDYGTEALAEVED